MLSSVVRFFFQAEDGIRDLTVTGVQTCALPIFYRVVRNIPKGRVATYGVVARLAGRPGAARTVGWALSALPDESEVPWWRVLNAAGRISLSGADHGSVVQRALLLREGVKFAPGGAVNLAAFGWPAEAYDSVAAAHTRAASSRKSRRLRGLRADRKSTRLNSSHSQISYAVFC